MTRRIDTSELGNVLVVKRKVLRSFKCLCEFSRDIGMLPAIMDNALFMSRRLIEEDTSYKQLIPYVVLTHNKRVLTYIRHEGVEPRLQGMVSFGFGGHVTEKDVIKGSFADTNTLWNAAKREIKEETGISLRESNEPFALINEDRTAVGRVHLGIVYLIDMARTADEQSLTDECTDFKLMPVANVHATKKLEPWSKILAKNIVSACLLH